MYEVKFILKTVSVLFAIAGIVLSWVKPIPDGELEVKLLSSLFVIASLVLMREAYMASEVEE